MATHSTRTRTRTVLVFVAGVLAGSALTASGVPTAASRYLHRPPPPASPGAVSPPAVPGPAPTPANHDHDDVRGSWLTLDEGGRSRECTAASVELLDPNSSRPRIIVWATCEGQRLSVVAHPERLPGTTRVDRLRLMSTTTGEEWTATDASLSVTELGEVGGMVAGEIEGTMSPRLNRGAVRVTATFRAERTRDRFAP